MAREEIGSFSVVGTNTTDKLIAGSSVTLLVEGVTLKSGQGVLSRGSVIGIINAVAGTVAVDEENTGDGAISGFAIGNNAQIGDYTVECTAAATDAGTFAVYAPDGTKMKDATAGVAYVSNQINFTIGVGETDYAVGDKFTLPVAAGNKGKLCDANSVDGSQVAMYVLAEDAIDTTADIIATCYKTGLFNREALVFGTNGAPATLDSDLRKVGIYLQDEVSY